MKKIFFIDRDGVINKEIGYLHEIERFVFIDGVIESLQYIQGKGYQIIVITNQSGIGRGLYSIDQFHELNDWMIAYLESKKIYLLDVFYCPHSPEEDCMCRKPKPGLYENAQKRYKIDMANSWSIGDKETDIIAAQKAGVKNTILVRSGHEIDEEQSNADYIFDSLKNIYSIEI